MRSRKISALAALALLASTASNAGIIFEDRFDTTGGTIENWDGGTNWNVQHGTVDLMLSGDDGISCLGGGGHCVDLDGTSRAAGEILSRNLGPLAAGDYNFSYWLSGNQRVDTQMDIAFSLSLSDTAVFSQATHILFGNAGWTRYTHSFTLDAVTDPVYLQFSHTGRDDVGILLDNVQLRISEPGTLALLGLGLLAMSRFGRRRRG